MILDITALLALLFATFPAVLFLRNLALYRKPSLPEPTSALPPVSVLIPARNEEAHIGAAIQSVLANDGVQFELIVLDDQSTDRTAAIVEEMMRRDSRVRLENAPPLPPGWCGKQHACAVLADRASNPILVFMDADVRLAPDALPSLLGFMQRSDAPLVSGVPCQELGTLWEKLLIPMIHFILLGFLPIARMRRSTKPVYGAGCGQLMIARVAEYRFSGGHAAIRASLHDGVTLPRAFRRAGFKTDLFDATKVARCRMYQHGREVLSGLAKNATEGLAAPARIVAATLLLFTGQVLPFLLLCWPYSPIAPRLLAAVGAIIALIPRVCACRRFHQPWLSAWLHPLGVLILLGIQWFALVRSKLGRPAVWRGRAYAKAAIAGVFIASTALMFGARTNQLQKTIGNFSLADQHGNLHRYEFPKTNISFVVVADKQGSEQLEEWIQPVAKRYGKRIDIDGVANLVRVPRPLRGMVQHVFLNRITYAVMLDWEGTVTGKFSPLKNVANVFVLARDGQVLEHLSGAADAQRLRRLYDCIDEALKPGHGH